MDAVITGTEDQDFDVGCHCAVIRFRVKGPLRQILMCHCSDCLKLSGTSWGASAAMLGHLTFLGTARPRWYRSSSWAERGFCPDCGPQMFYTRDGRDQISIAPGAFDNSDMVVVAGKIFRHEHLSWGPVIPDNLPDLDIPENGRV